MTLAHPAIAHVRNNQRQLDRDGVTVGVSRQALDEVLDFATELYEALALTCGSLQMLDERGHTDATWHTAKRNIAIATAILSKVESK